LPISDGLAVALNLEYPEYNSLAFHFRFNVLIGRTLS